MIQRDVVRRPVVAVAAAAVLLGVLYAVLVPPGLPYDEPSHWQNVVFLLEHGRLFDLRDADVSYEAQQGPLAYLFYAVPAGLVRLFGLSSSTQFVVARLTGLILLVALVVSSYKLGRLVVPQRQVVAVVATGVVCLNPMVVAMASSIQNDVLALVLAVTAMTITAEPQPLTRPKAALLGLLTGAALLTKITVAPAVIVVGLVLILRRTSMARLATVCVVALTVSGWWFARNVFLYGDLTGRAGVSARGFEFPAAPVRDLGGAKDLLAGMITYLWVPTEYYRNVIDLPPAVRAAIALLTFVLVTLGLRPVVLHRRILRGTAAQVVLATAALALLTWIATRFAVQGVSARTAFVALPAWGLLAAAAVVRSRSASTRWGVIAVAVLVAILHVAILVLTTRTLLPVELLRL